MANQWVLLQETSAQLGGTAMGYPIKAVSDKTVEILGQKQCRTFRNRTLFQGTYRHVLVTVPSGTKNTRY